MLAIVLDRVRRIGARASVRASLNLPALALTLAAMVAIFRFRAGPIPVLAGCALAGALLWLVPATIH